MTVAATNIDPFDDALATIARLLGLLGIERGISEIIMQLIAAHAPPQAIRSKARQGPTPQSLGEIARLFYRTSMKRNAMLGGQVVQEGAWHMLLDLFAAAEEGRPISVSSLCIASGVPMTTALRALSGMQDKGIVRRADDPDDGRRRWVTLSGEAQDRMADMIRAFTVPTPAPLILVS